MRFGGWFGALLVGTLACSASRRAPPPAPAPAGAPPASSEPVAPRLLPRTPCSPAASLADTCELWLATKQQREYAPCSTKDCEASPLSKLGQLTFHLLQLDYGACGPHEPQCQHVGVRGLPAHSTNFEEPSECQATLGHLYRLVVAERAGRFWPLLTLESFGREGLSRSSSVGEPSLTHDGNVVISVSTSAGYADDDGVRTAWSGSVEYTFDLDRDLPRPLREILVFVKDEDSEHYWGPLENDDLDCTSSPCPDVCPF